MELNEELNVANNELKIYKEEIKKINAEKIALDQSFVQSLQEKIKLMTQNILNEEKIRVLNQDILILNKEKLVLQNELDALKSASVESQIAEILDNAS